MIEQLFLLLYRKYVISLTQYIIPITAKIISIAVEIAVTKITSLYFINNNRIGEVYLQLFCRQ